MRTPVSKAVAERRIAYKFNKLFVPLMELVSALADAAPFDTVVAAVLSRNEVGEIQATFRTHPLTLTVCDGDKQMTLQISRAKDQPSRE